MKFSSGKFPFSSFRFSEEDDINNITLNFPDDKMLGKQAESLFEFYLKNSKRYELLAANIQIQGVHATLGELDYLVQDTQKDQLLHIEFAAKFYLYDPSLGGRSENNWIGPNRKDTLREKLDKLALKQFPLIKRAETRVTLKKLNIDSNNIGQQLCLKAFLFFQKGFTRNQLPDNYRSCVVGYWIPFSEFKYEDTLSLYAIPKKKEWLLPLENIEKWVDFSEAQSIIKSNIDTKKSTLVYRKKNTIISRFFVVWW